MKLARKLAVGVALAVAMMANAAGAADMKIGLVVKSLGNGFFDAANKGAQEAAKVRLAAPQTARINAEIALRMGPSVVKLPPRILKERRREVLWVRGETRASRCARRYYC